MERIPHGEYYHARHGCYTCFGQNDLVDTSIQIEGEGVLAICRGCVATMAETVGFVLSDQQGKIEQLSARLAQAEKERDEAQRTLKRLHQYGERVENLEKANKALKEKRAK